MPQETCARLLVLCLALASTGLLPAQESNSEPKPDENPAPVPLFNGTNLDHWTTWLADSQYEDPRNVFSVTNGLLRISGEGLGYLRSKSEYENYRLVVEFRWGNQNWHWADRKGRARDSGLFLHAVGPDGNSIDGNGAFMAAIECNLFEGATGDFLLIRGRQTGGKLIQPYLTSRVAESQDPDGWFTWNPNGRELTLLGWGRINWSEKSPQWKDITGFRGPHDQERPAGEWNRIECLCRGDTIEIRVNGELVNRATRVWPSRGHILIQCEGSEIFFRSVTLHPTP